MDFPGILKVVKIQNPELSHKDAQKKASEMLKKFKAAQDEFVPPPLPAATPLILTPPPRATTMPVDALGRAEKRIREIGVNVPSIIRNGREAIPDGELVKHGKSGVNTLVTWENKAGSRLPVSGYFVVWI